VRLDQRLRQLRSEVPQTPAVAAKGALAERLRLLGVRKRQPSPSQPADERDLVDRLGAERLAPGVLRVEQRFNLDVPHGGAKPRDCRVSLPDLMAEPVGHPSGWLFLDTETSGLAGGTGTWAFLCGLLRFEGQGLLLRQYLLARLDAERPYLEAIGDELKTASLLVTYNGKSFDGPLLTTRLRLAGLSFDVANMRHLDLLHLVRRAFAPAWPDCRLVTVEERLLGLRRQGDLPGSDAPRAWLAWLRHGQASSLAEVLSHNRQDLLSLPALADVLAHTLRCPRELGADVRSVAGYWLARGQEAFALAILAQGREALNETGLLDLARLHRRCREWSQAHRIWRSLAERGHPGGTEALTKYLEHRERDYAQALLWVDRLPAGPDREHRRQRLEDKLRARAVCSEPS
jgi:uncharacterized protein